MNPEEQTIVERFVLRHANLSLLDYALGEDIFDKLFGKRLGRRDKDYFIFLAADEEKQLLAAQKTDPGSKMQVKLATLLENVRLARKIFTAQE